MNAVLRSAQPGPRIRQQKRELPASIIVRHGDTDRLFNAHTALDEWAMTGPFEVTLQAWEPTRSTEQHNLFFAWCEILARHIREAGQPACKDSVHDWILGAVYGWEDMGLGRTRPRETLTRPHQKGKLKMIELLARFEAEANTEFCCSLPRPATWDEDLEEARKAYAKTAS